ncbi:penicillin-binding protein 2 [Gammaproteobacteria bacterium]|nr:penicillin-binding protein 2 [Gammaproteobacteria bacterium]
MSDDQTPVVKPPQRYFVRQYVLLALLFLGFAALITRAGYLQVVMTDYLQAQGDARYERVVETKANRGLIIDRRGEILAVSTPVDSVWAHPPTLLYEGHSWRRLAELLQMPESRLRALAKAQQDREFVYLKRHLSPPLAQQVIDLDIPGVGLRREYRRYYPAGPVFGQILGFTDIDDVGQEGLERAYNDQLTGQSGKARVLRDRVGHIVESMELINPAVDGEDLAITLDSRIQYLAYRHLSAAVNEHQAKSGSVVVIDVSNGDVLAMVNQPKFNPNNRRDRKPDQFRNRAVTDVFEPGSTVKPFTVAMALQSKLLVPDSRIDTTPGVLRIGRNRVRDHRDYGLLTVSRVIMKSSNVGAAKIAMMAEPQHLVDMLKSAGFGARTRVGFPGEVTGMMPARQLKQFEHATLSFGYGLSSTTVQLARAYSALANGGRLLSPRLVKSHVPEATREVFQPHIAKQIRNMLEMAVSEQGTGATARVARYRIAGKTGTTHMIIDGKYAKDRYRSLFAGYGPASNPRLVMVVVIDDPRGEHYYGGKVAAPVFSKVMSGALRLLNVPPDLDPSEQKEGEA